MRGDVSVGVTAQTGRLFRPRQASERHRAADLDRMDVDADADAGCRH
jgi:hypothetical protein